MSKYTFPAQYPDNVQPGTASEHQHRAMHLLGQAERNNVRDPEVANLIAAAEVHMIGAVVALMHGDTEKRETGHAEHDQASQAAVQPARPAARVRVFHNTHADGMLRGYSRAHSLVEVYAYDDVDVTPTTTDEALAERAFVLFNDGNNPVSGDPDHRAREYRERGNRSLSKGDAVAIDGRFYACAGIGWSWIEIDDPVLIRLKRFGTTPLYWPTPAPAEPTPRLFGEGPSSMWWAFAFLPPHASHARATSVERIPFSPRAARPRARLVSAQLAGAVLPGTLAQPEPDQLTKRTL